MTTWKSKVTTMGLLTLLAGTSVAEPPCPQELGDPGDSMVDMLGDASALAGSAIETCFTGQGELSNDSPLSALIRAESCVLAKLPEIVGRQATEADKAVFRSALATFQQRAKALCSVLTDSADVAGAVESSVKATYQKDCEVQALRGVGHLVDAMFGGPTGSGLLSARTRLPQIYVQYDQAGRAPSAVVTLRTNITQATQSLAHQLVEHITTRDGSDARMVNARVQDALGGIDEVSGLCDVVARTGSRFVLQTQLRAESCRAQVAAGAHNLVRRFGMID